MEFDNPSAKIVFWNTGFSQFGDNGLWFGTEWRHVPTHEAFEEIVQKWRKFYDAMSPEKIAEWNEWADIQAHAHAGAEKLPFDNLADYKAYLASLPPPKIKVSIPGVIYLLGSDTGHYKIGKTKNLKARMHNFGLQLPFKVELLHSIETSDITWAEIQLHAKFADKRLNGEWFNLSPKDIGWLKTIERLDKD